MDILTLELLDVTAYQALLALREHLQAHPLQGFRVTGQDELVRGNVVRFLEKQGRRFEASTQGRAWALAVESLATTRGSLVRRPPVLLTRAAFAPGDRALGRQLLLGVIRTLDRGVSWLCLAHEALQLLEDPMALEAFEALREDGMAVFVSEASVAWHGGGAPFPLMKDEVWQEAMGRGELTVL
ncbi:MAG TPA: hypothetical protein VJ505_10615 [Holophagaceae bacterium]|nr:hypothetical protein [Holophagaceae bacterium]